MSVPLAWILSQPDLGLRLLAGTTDGVEVAWAHAIELVDPSPWLTGRELILTTGLRLPRSVAEQAAYVDRLVAHGVGALAFGVGIRWAEVPRSVIDRCVELGLALLEVPLATPFIAIAQAVGRRLSDDRERGLQRVVRVQQTLTRATLREGVSGLVRRLERELSVPVVVVDDSGALICRSPGAEALIEPVRAAVTARTHPAGTRLLGGPDDPALELHALTGRARRQGWLGVRGLGASVPESRIMLNHAISLATLNLDEPTELKGTRTELGATVLDLLLDAPASVSLPSVLSRIGFLPGEDLVILFLDLAGPDRGRDLPLPPGWLDRIPHMMTRRSGGVVVAVPSQAAPEATRTTVAELSHRYANLTVGVSASSPPQAAATALGSARRAAEAARLLGEQVGLARELALESVLADAELRARLGAVTRPNLDRLLADPAAKELVRTLAAYLDHEGAWERASRALGVHRHTLRNRIVKVEMLTGLLLDVPGNRLVLSLALATLDADG